MKIKLLVLALLVLPFVSSAETVMYTMKEGETIEDVRKDFAKQYKVPPESFWIWDDEFNPKQLYIDVPSNPATSTDTKPVDSSKLEAEVSLLEAENAQLKTKISLLEQIISLLKTLIGFKQ